MKKNFTQIPNEILDAPLPDTISLILLHCYRSSNNPEWTISRPSMASILDRSKPTISRAFTELIKCGVLVENGYLPHKYNDITLYKFCEEKVKDLIFHYKSQQKPVSLVKPVSQPVSQPVSPDAANNTNIENTNIEKKNIISGKNVNTGISIAEDIKIKTENLIEETAAVMTENVLADNTLSISGQKAIINETVRITKKDKNLTPDINAIGL